MLHILPTLANETISEENGDYCPVFAFSRPTQLVKMLRNALRHTDWKRRFVVYKQDQSAVRVRVRLFFHYLWLEKGEDFSLDNVTFFCVWPNWYCANK